MSEVNEALKTIPELEAIFKETIKSLQLDKTSSDEIVKNFEKLIKEVELTAFKIYKEHEDRAFKKLAEIWINNRKEWISKILKERGEEGIKDIISEFVKPIREMEFRAGQMRKVRGGKTFEHAIKVLLNLAGVPCEEPHKETKKILKRIDLVSPDAETARQTPDKAVFIALKRTLRERWKQIVPEHMKSARLYLVTINGKLPEEKAKEIRETGMIVYVKDELKEQPHLQDKPWVRKLSDLPKDIRNMVPKPRQTKLG
jgi:hypothetical protein